MFQNLTDEQITQLAPDAASVKAGRGLAVTSKWSMTGCSDRALWGICQGSGKNPYQTAVDLNGMAFKCSCPSRKFPCKHCLGLLYLHTSHPDAFGEAEEPEWVNTWLTKREEKAEKKERKEKAPAPVDEAAREKRLHSRHEKVTEGVGYLQAWIKDLVRGGLLNVPERAENLFGDAACRMVDCQAPGLASRLKVIRNMDFSRETWKYSLTERLAAIYLLCDSYRNLASQPEEWQTEILTQIGFPQSKEDVLCVPGVSDRWLSLCRRVRKNDGLITVTDWLYGCESSRFAVCLDFIPAGKTPEVNLLPGCACEGEICFYKGVGQRRGVFRSFRSCGNPFVPEFHVGLKEASSEFRKTARLNPFTEVVPLLVGNLRMAESGGRNCLVDAEGRYVPVDISEKKRIDILAVTGGHPFLAFILADSLSWTPVSIWFDSEFYSLKDELD